MSDKINFPALITRGLFIFPDQTHVIEVGRPKSVFALEVSRNEYNGFLICIAQKVPSVNKPDINDVFDVGTLCQIKVVVKNQNSYSVTIKGIKRVKLNSMIIREPGLWYATATELIDKKGKKSTELAYVRKIVGLLEELGPEQKMPDGLINSMTNNIDAFDLINSIANYLPMPVEKKYKLLRENNLNKRLEKLLKAVDFEMQVSTMEDKINEDIKGKINENQREYYLRERIKSIQAELGEMENGISETEMFKQKVSGIKMPDNIKVKIEGEIRKLEKIPSSSAEYSVIRTYIEVMLSIPWSNETQDKSSLVTIKKALNKKHFGLEKVKERIIEYIAVKEHTKSLKSPILCLVGPPGVGKTSLAYSIAEGLGRKFAKAALGGVRDESEIRGHRKTYLGSMPGRIIKGMIKSGVTNPVFLLDEIDKMASDYKGDPSSAMLEVLDPEQNKSFSDHYVDEDYDLSKVMFIATANYFWNIPAALRDRLEVIELSSYTEQEKVKIASKYLIPNTIEKHKINATQIKISDEVLIWIIRHYTRESGVRELGRILDKIARKIVVKMTINKRKSTAIISKKTITEFLGKEKFDHTDKEKRPQVGVVTGLAWTQFGGDILPVEVNHFKGKGDLVITGSLGEVMQESAKIAISFVRSNAKKYGISNEIFEKEDIHIHVPEGATPKDGPSAGITMSTAIISALTNKPVNSLVAMTGEVNLRGHVMPIGGLKEKSISAHRSGIKKILIPWKNKVDLDKIPKEVKKGLEIVAVKTMDEVLKHALVVKK